MIYSAVLTARQNQIVECVVLGMRNKEIADTLGISLQTVKNSLVQISEKLGVESRTSLAVHAVFWGIYIEPAIQRIEAELAREPVLV